MLIDACGSGATGDSRDSAADLPNPAVPTQQDGAATSDAGSDAQTVDGKGLDAEGASPADAGKTALWDTICE